MDEILDFAKPVFRFLLWQLIWLTLLFNVGRVSLLAITLGKYPRGNLQPKDQTIASTFGLAIVFLVWLSIVIFNRLQ
ncbi:hypothetical protein [Arenicella chitinivorans]|uniref:hypothetical protein n=1 Tax=Arenicella chitinivorans TaxID=1329800 RepID=UPI001671B162|nr:hypothetical protein [Arenicella chitinivorans]